MNIFDLQAQLNQLNQQSDYEQIIEQKLVENDKLIKEVFTAQSCENYEKS